MDASKSTKSTLYALIVGVGAYEKVRPLSGPAGDAQAVATYVQQLTDFEPDLVLLTDQQASKQAIINGFLQHLAQAGPADAVLFYFAGHGAQEAADTSLWTTEADGHLECLVCHDAGTSQFHEFMLADKELRYLIRKVSAGGAHVLTIFDCCHSGDNTRAVDLLAAALNGQDVRERRLLKSAPQRPYEGFCFHEAVPADVLRTQGVAVALPEGAHVQITACESDESAIEANAEGIFTKNLLMVLRAAHGQLSYGDLHNRVRQYMRFAYEQRPRVYVPDQSPELMSRGFLNQPINPDTLSASATYNAREGWLLDVGAIHGLTQTNRAIDLIDPVRQTTRTAAVGRVGPDYAVLTLTDEVAAQLDQSVIYRAVIAGLLTRPIRLHLTNHGGPNSDLTTLLQPAGDPGQLSLTAGIVIPEDDETQADYSLHARNGLYFVTRPADENRPLIRPIATDDSRWKTYLTDDMRHMAKWEYLRQLRNPAVADPVLGIDLIAQGGSTIHQTEAHGAAIPVTYLDSNGSWSTTLTVVLTNPTDQPLYCTALYLSRDFMSFTGFLPTNYRLEPGQQVTLGLADRKAPTGRQTTFRFKLEEVIRQYNWPHATEYIKLLVTTDPVSEKTLAFLTLDPLPSPATLADRLKPATSRGGIEIDADEAEPLPEWSTQTIALKLVNPLYNMVWADELSQMLTPPITDPAYDDTMADFVLGLYFETDNSGPQPRLVPRSGLQVITADQGQRGLWTDLKLALANGVAHRIQNRQYRQNLVRYPDRLRIVAEGDSWFQYPFLLRDIIDYLSGVYSVFSVAAAGATLDDYLKNSEFLESIGQVKPSFFLLSGGGNDLLGDGFAALLRDAPDLTRTGADRYLADGFETTLTAVCERYKRILRLVHLGYPQVQVLVHGYDYVIPSGVEERPGKASWMGEIMTRKGIDDPAEREAIAHSIIDAFNERLRTVAGQYPNVTFLDLRGTVRRTGRLADYWYDEIHPNDKGFLSLSSKFVAAITSHVAARNTQTAGG